jgi:signal transduction histidine kinase
MSAVQTLAARPEGSLRRWERLLLEAELGSLADAPSRSARDWVVDVVLFVYAGFAALATTVNDHGRVSPAVLVVDAALAVPACLVLWGRRRHPLAAAWVAVLASAVSNAAIHAGFVAVFSAAIHARPRRAVPVAVAAVATAAVNCAIYTGTPHGYDWNAFSRWTLAAFAAFAFGSFVRVRRELVVSLHERSRHLESEQQLRVREARLAERNRIAREMHDVLAHRISLLNVHAGALEVHPDAPPEQLARAASVIRMSARGAHEELRSVIGVLRADAGGEALEPPQPSTADLAALVEESRHAGMAITLSDRLPREPPPELVGRTVYRVVQEALTNARRHAPGQPVAVSLAVDGAGAVAIAVVNRPAVGAVGAPPAAAGSGTGLVGLAERVTLAGGTLAHGALPDGGFRLCARIPWTRA